MAKKARFKKGSPEAKAYMAAIRQGKKGTVASGLAAAFGPKTMTAKEHKKLVKAHKRATRRPAGFGYRGGKGKAITPAQRAKMTKGYKAWLSRGKPAAKHNRKMPKKLLLARAERLKKLAATR